MRIGASPVAQPVQEMRVRSLSGEHLLEEEMAKHSSILAWRISGREESGRLQSAGLTKSWIQLKRLSRQAGRWLKHKHLFLTVLEV